MHSKMAAWSDAQWAAYNAQWQWSGSGDWSGSDWHGGGGLSPHTGKGQGQGRQRGEAQAAGGQGKGTAQEQGKGRGQAHSGGSSPLGGTGKGQRQDRDGQGATAEAAGGTGKGKGNLQGGQSKGQGQASSSGAAQGGGVSPSGGLSGQEFIRKKRRRREAPLSGGQTAPKETEAGRLRQQKSEWYAAQASRSGGVSPQAESIPHSMTIPWPYSFAEMGQEFMKTWIEEGDERGFNLRLSGFRNSQWKESPEQCASMYRLRITHQEKKPDRAGAVELFFELAKASRQMGLKDASLPCQQIIEWWDGEDRTGSRR